VASDSRPTCLRPPLLGKVADHETALLIGRGLVSPRLFTLVFERVRCATGREWEPNRPHAVIASRHTMAGSGRRVVPCMAEQTGGARVMHSVFYIIGVIVVVLAILSLIGVA
jgi:hypothetical protein